MLIIGFSLPGQSLQRFSMFTPDKIWHVGSFLILALLWLRVYPTAGIRILLYGALFGILTEVYQHVMPIGRTFDPFDVVADVGGLLVGTQIGPLLSRIKKTRAAEQL